MHNTWHDQKKKQQKKKQPTTEADEKDSVCEWNIWADKMNPWK